MRGQHIDVVVVERGLAQLRPGLVAGLGGRTIGHLVLPRQQLPQPGDLVVVLVAGRELPAVAARAGLLVAPVRGHAVFGEAVHLLGADLHLERAAVVADHDGVQRLIAVRLGPRDVVVELARHRLPEMMHDAEHRIAILDVGHDHAKCPHVVELGKIELLAAHLAPDAVDVFRPAADLGRDLCGGQLPLEPLDRMRDVGFALGALLVEQLGDTLVGDRVLEAEREILEFPLQLPDAEPVRERRVDIERLARHVGRRLQLGGRIVAQRLQPRGEPDHHHADVLREREQHLAQRLDLRAPFGLCVTAAVARLARRDQADGAELQQLAGVGHQPRDLRAEALRDLGFGIVQMRREREQRGGLHRLRIDVERAHDRDDAGRVIGEPLARRLQRVTGMLADIGKHLVERGRRVSGGIDVHWRLGIGISALSARIGALRPSARPPPPLRRGRPGSRAWPPRSRAAAWHPARPSLPILRSCRRSSPCR